MSAPSAINEVFLKTGHYWLDTMLLYCKQVISVFVLVVNRVMILFPSIISIMCIPDIIGNRSPCILSSFYAVGWVWIARTEIWDMILIQNSFIPMFWCVMEYDSWLPS